MIDGSAPLWGGGVEAVRLRIVVPGILAVIAVVAGVVIAPVVAQAVISRYI